MKKLKYILPLIILLVITGCGSPKQQLERSIIKMKDMKSATVEIKADMEVPVLGQKLNAGLDITGDMINLNDKNKMKTHLNTNVNFLVNIKTESYSHIKDGYVYTYTKSNDKWKYNKAKIEENNTENNFSKEDIITMLETFKDVQASETDKEGYTKLLVTLNKDSINSLYNKYANKNTSNNINIEKDVVATIYLKDGYIAIIDMDLSDMIKNDKNDITAHITISLSNINKVKDFDIPNEVVENATEDYDKED